MALKNGYFEIAKLHIEYHTNVNQEISFLIEESLISACVDQLDIDAVQILIRS